MSAELRMLHSVREGASPPEYVAAPYPYPYAYGYLPDSNSLHMAFGTVGANPVPGGDPTPPPDSGGGGEPITVVNDTFEGAAGTSTGTLGYAPVNWGMPSPGGDYPLLELDGNGNAVQPAAGYGGMVKTTSLGGQEQWAELSFVFPTGSTNTRLNLDIRTPAPPHVPGGGTWCYNYSAELTFPGGAPSTGIIRREGSAMAEVNAPALTVDTDYVLRVEVIGGRVTAFLNGTEYASYDDPDPILTDDFCSVNVNGPIVVHSLTAGTL